MRFHKRQQSELIELIRNELYKQDKKFPNQKHELFKWLSIIGEEVGELHKEALELHLHEWNFENISKELIQIITLCVRLLYTPHKFGFNRDDIII